LVRPIFSAKLVHEKIAFEAKSTSKIRNFIFIIGKVSRIKYKGYFG